MTAYGAVHREHHEDPALAIGSGKELVEAVCKLLLDDAGIQPDSAWTAEQLFKQAPQTLDLSVDDVPDPKAGAESIKKVLWGMHQAVVGTAELRNRFGTGHGRHRRSALGPPHPRLVAAAALGLARFLLDTRAEKRGGDADKAERAAWTALRRPASTKCSSSTRRAAHDDECAPVARQSAPSMGGL